MGLLALTAFVAAIVGATPPAVQPSVSVVWHPDTLSLVREGAGYGRIARIGPDELLCAYGHGKEAWVSRSLDGGRTWIDPRVAARIDYAAAANSEILVTRRGEVLHFINERPTDGKSPFAISVVRSSDGGRTWSPRQLLYRADSLFENGCWEPAAVEIPGGPIRLVFANESPYRNSGEQEITMMSSWDGGRTWTRPRAVSFRPGHRDGMPVPALARDGRTLFVAIEDNGLVGPAMKPTIVQVARPLPVMPGSPHRWGALAEPAPAELNIAAPYLVMLPEGGSLLSCQISEPGGEPQMVVYAGDSMARGFGRPTKPFASVGAVQGLWNSLFVASERSVIAVTGAVIGGRVGLWTMEGTIKPAPGRRANHPVRGDAAP